MFKFSGPHCWQCSGHTLQVHLAGGGKVYTNGANVFSVVFTPPPPSHHGCIWLLTVISYSLLTLPIYMIGEVSWEPKRRRAWASQYLILRRSIHNAYCTAGKKGYTLHLHVHTTGGGRDTPCTVLRQNVALHNVYVT